jgi:nucleoredoxin
MSLAFGRLQNSKSSVTDSISAPYVLLYFSAHWCAPCRSFTPILKEFVSDFRDDNKENNKFEVVFVSFDETEQDALSYFQNDQGDWFMVDYTDEDTRKRLREQYGSGKGLPCLAVVNASTGDLITNDGVSDLKTLGFMAADMKWGF